MALLIAWQIGLWIDLPFPNGDGIWSLSQTFSLLRGEFLKSTFGHNYWPIVQVQYLYSVFTAPFYGLYHMLFMHMEYSIFVFNELLLVFLLWLLYRLLTEAKNASPLFVFVSLVCVFTSPYSMNLRPELLNIVGMVLVLFVLRKYGKEPSIKWIVITALLTVLVGIVHPIGGILTIILVGLFGWRHKFQIPFYWKYVGGVVLGLLILYVPIVAIDVRSWLSQMMVFSAGGADSHTFSPELVKKYFFLAPGLPALYLVALWTNRGKGSLSELLVFCSLLLVFAFLGRSYYFPYLTVFIFWRFSELQKCELRPILAFLFAAISPFMSHYVPTVQQLENRAYVRGFKESLDVVRNYADYSESHRVWVTGQLAMPVIDRPGARLYVPSYVKLAGQPMRFQNGDILFYMGTPEKDKKLWTNLGMPQDSLAMERTIGPISGLLRADEFFSGRTEELSLWNIRKR